MKSISQYRNDLNKMFKWFTENPDSPQRETNRQILNKHFALLHKKIESQDFNVLEAEEYYQRGLISHDEYNKLMNAHESELESLF